MTLNGVMTVILRFLTEFRSFTGRLRLRRKYSPKNVVFSDISPMAIFAEVTENERIIDRHMRGIHPLLDYNASESQSMISV